MDSIILSFAQKLLFSKATAENLALQTYGIIKRDVVWSNIEAVNYFELVVYTLTDVKDFYVFLQKLKDTVWELQVCFPSRCCKAGSLAKGNR